LPRDAEFLDEVEVLVVEEAAIQSDDVGVVEEALDFDLSDELRQVTGIDHLPTDNFHGADEPAGPVLRDEDLPELAATESLPHCEVRNRQLGRALFFVPVGVGGDSGHGLGVWGFHWQMLPVIHPPVRTVTVLLLLLLH
jgi:hypothetical protein